MANKFDSILAEHDSSKVKIKSELLKTLTDEYVISSFKHLFTVEFDEDSDGKESLEHSGVVVVEAELLPNLLDTMCGTMRKKGFKVKMENGKMRFEDLKLS